MSQPVTFCTVIESGALESEALLLFESIRALGGLLARAPIIAGVPRFGVPLKRSTKRALQRLDVELINAIRKDELTWFPYLNKTAVLVKASEMVSGTIVWLDADIAVLKDIPLLNLDGSPYEFAASCTDKNIGTARDDDEYAPYFQACCKGVGVDFESLPYIITEREKIAIRSYWNSGVFSFLANTGLATKFDEFTKTLIRSGIANRGCGIFVTDQIALSLAVNALKLSVLSLPQSYNYHAGDANGLRRAIERNDEINILHYHGANWHQSHYAFCDALNRISPEAAQLFKNAGPIDRSLPWPAKAARKLIGMAREHRQRVAMRAMTFY